VVTVAERGCRTENFVTDLVPSEIACLASSPGTGRVRRSEVWISSNEIIDLE
jgi:hypothetical protein